MKFELLSRDLPLSLFFFESNTERQIILKSKGKRMRKCNFNYDQKNFTLLERKSWAPLPLQLNCDKRDRVPQIFVNKCALQLMILGFVIRKTGLPTCVSMLLFCFLWIWTIHVGCQLDQTIYLATVRVTWIYLYSKQLKTMQWISNFMGWSGPRERFLGNSWPQLSLSWKLRASLAPSKNTLFLKNKLI